VLASELGNRWHPVVRQMSLTRLDVSSSRPRENAVRVVFEATQGLNQNREDNMSDHVYKQVETDRQFEGLGDRGDRNSGFCELRKL